MALSKILWFLKTIKYTHAGRRIEDTQSCQRMNKEIHNKKIFINKSKTEMYNLQDIMAEKKMNVDKSKEQKGLVEVGRFKPTRTRNLWRPKKRFVP